MRRLLALAAALALTTAPAYAQKWDANGRCHDVHGKFAKAAACAGVPKPAAHTYKLDTKGKCRDEKGHFAATRFCRH